MLLESMGLLSNNFFHTNLLILSKLQTVINFHFLMMGASGNCYVIAKVGQGAYLLSTSYCFRS